MNLQKRITFRKVVGLVTDRNERGAMRLYDSIPGPHRLTLLELNRAIHLGRRNR